MTWTGNSFTFHRRDGDDANFVELDVTGTLSADHQTLTSLAYSLHDKLTFNPNPPWCAEDECFQEKWRSVALANVPIDSSIYDPSNYFFRANGAPAGTMVTSYYGREHSVLYSLFSGKTYFDCTSPLDPSRPEWFEIDVQVEAFEPPTADLVAYAIEVTQAVQDLDDSVRLVARKPTFVRLLAYSLRGSFVTTAKLHLSTGVTLLPINPGGKIGVRSNFHVRQRGWLHGAFLFYLPSGFAEGEVTFTAELNPDDQPAEIDKANNTVSVTRSFEAVPAANLVVFPVRYGPPGNRHEASDLHVTKLASWLRRAYPIANLHFSWRRTYDAGADLPTCELVNATLSTVRLVELYGQGRVGPTARYYGMVDDAGGFMRGCAMGIPSFVASGPTGDPNGFSFNWDRDGSYGDWYGGHELAHTWGRFHAQFCGALDGVAFPYADGKISGGVPGRSELYGFDIETRDIYPPAWTDLMTYCDRLWISDFTYEGLMDRLQGEGGPAAVRAAALAANPTDRLLVVGSIDPATKHVELQPLFILPSAGELAPRVPGPHAIVLRSAAGGELARYPFTPHPSHVETNTPDGNAGSETPLLFIEELVPFVAGTTRVDIEGPTGLLHTVTAGANPPQVTITVPHGGEVLSNATIPVEWTASDPDGDPLQFVVQYSPDNGATWRVVAQNVTGHRVDLDARDLPAGASARFSVWASDGIHTAQDESAAVVAPNHVPTVAIIQPSGAVTLASGQTLVLQADAYDFDTGSMDEEVQWRSSRDGLFGNGAALGVSTLSVGRHTITAQVDDGAGGDAAAAVQVTIVGDLSQLPPVPDALSLSSRLIVFDPPAGGTSDTVMVANENAEHAMPWSATVSAPWIVLGADTGVTPAEVTVSLAAAGLGAGNYLGTITFLSSAVPDRIHTVFVRLTLAGVSPCVGDCNGDGAVTVDDLLRMVNVALGTTDVSSCPAGDAGADGQITIDEILEAVNHALIPCQVVAPTVTPTRSVAVRTSTPTRSVGPTQVATPTRTVAAPTPTLTPAASPTRTPIFAYTATATRTSVLPATPAATRTPSGGTAHYCSDSAHPIDIPDDDPFGVGSVIRIDESVRIDRLKITVWIEHSWVGDLVVTLTRPGELTTVTLVDRPGYPSSLFGCSEHDILCELVDDSTVPAEDECASDLAALQGSLQPAEPLAVFSGSGTAGAWQLGVADLSAIGTGRLIQWCIDAN